MPDRRRAWAKALYDVAGDLSTRQIFGSCLESLSKHISEDRNLSNFLDDPKIKRQDKIDLLFSVYHSLVPEDQSRGKKIFLTFCELLVDKKRSTLIPQISSIYQEMLDKEEGLARLTIEAARQADEESIAKISAAWQKYSGAKKTLTEVKIIPSLIAGYILKVGFTQMDFSTKGRLKRINEALKKPIPNL